MGCCKALRAATTPHQAVDRSWADVQVIGNLLHCGNTCAAEENISTTDSACGALDFQLEHPEGDQGGPGFPGWEL
jgi:hypothetical protein